jgi:lysophospholipase L1-like esterase
LQAIKEKCEAYGIIVVFLTATPINPTMMVSRAQIEQPPYDWQMHQQYINAWVMKQQYHVDVSTALTDSLGNLRSTYTTDGLHPDYYGKKYIGEQVGRYLQMHFAWITNTLTKKPIPEYSY